MIFKSADRLTNKSMHWSKIRIIRVIWAVTSQSIKWLAKEWKMWIRFPTEAGIFVFATRPEDLQNSHLVDAGVISSDWKLPGIEADHSHAYSNNGKNYWSYTSTVTKKTHRWCLSREDDEFQNVWNGNQEVLEEFFLRFPLNISRCT
jgi:hypothetical protein